MPWSYMSKKVILTENFKKRHNFEIAMIEMKMMNIFCFFFFFIINKKYSFTFNLVLMIDTSSINISF